MHFLPFIKTVYKIRVDEWIKSVSRERDWKCRNDENLLIWIQSLWSASFQFSGIADRIRKVPRRGIGIADYIRE